MGELAKGANVPVTAPLVRATLFWSGGDGVPEVDASALLLQADGRVASDADFVFYNQPEHISGAVKIAGRASGAQAHDVIDLNLAAMPPTVERVALAASADGGTFGQVPQLRLAVSDLSSSEPIAQFPMTAGDETAFVTGEFYRRDGGWKFRAVGQGFASGLAGLAGEFGIDVGGGSPDEPDALEPSPEAEAEAAVAALAGPVLPPPSFAPAEVVPAPPPPPPPAQLWTAPAAPQPPPAAPAPPPPPVDDGPVRLQRNERVTLASSSGPLQRVMLDLAWEPAPGRLSVDLDASVIAFDSSAKKLEIVWYQHQNEFAGALQHTGDAKGDTGQVATERLLVDLARLPEHVYALVFTISSFHGHTFTDLKYASCVLGDDTGRPIVTYDLTDTQPSTAVLMAILRRDGPGLWQMRAIGEYHDCRTVKKLVDPAARHVGMP